MNIILISKIYFNISVKEFEEMATKVAEELNDQTMFNWKIWMLNKEEKIGATIYSLDSWRQVAVLEDYLNTMGLLYDSLLHKIEIEKYEVLEKPTILNFGPITFETQDTLVSNSE